MWPNSAISCCLLFLLCMLSLRHSPGSPLFPSPTHPILGMDGEGPWIFAKRLPAFCVDLSWASSGVGLRWHGGLPLLSGLPFLHFSLLCCCHIMWAAGLFWGAPLEARLCLTLRSYPVERWWGLSCSPWNSAWKWRPESLHWVSLLETLRSWLSSEDLYPVPQI